MNFEFYFKNTYKDKIDEYICRYINRDNYETSIKRIYVENVKEMTCFVYITLYVDYYVYQDNEEKKCLTVKCYVDLENENSFKVLEIVDYEKPLMNNYSLDSKTLLPYLPRNKYDDVANEILEKYFTNEELKEYIDAKELARRMGLVVQYHRISCDSKIFGLTCFKDCVIKIYDNDIEKNLFIKKGTIVIDSMVSSDYGGFNSENFTIAHECVHWYIHRKYFFLESDYLNYVSCSDDGIISNILSFNDDFMNMEYQANGIAARILLPYTIVKNDFNNVYNFLILTDNKRETYEKCIDNISIKSHVSREAVKIRLKETGYKVEGIFEYVDGIYLNSYLHNNDYGYDESYSITEFDLLKFMMSNEEFRFFSKTNNYLFIDNHLCINDGKYITQDFEMTDYALEHIDECCILFKYTSVNKKKSITIARSVLFRANSKGRDFFVESFKLPINVTIDENVSIVEEYEKIKSLLARIHDMDIQSALRECREALQISQLELANLSNYSEQTIKDIETKIDRKISLDNILRLSIGMRLPKEVIYRLLEIGDYSLDNDMSERNILYRVVIDYMLNSSIHDIDLFLIKYKQEPLFYEITEYK